MELKLKDRDRISVLRQVSEGVLSAAAGAERLDVTPRQFRRLRRRYEAEGDESVVHGLRGRPSNSALPAAVRELVLEVASDPIYRGFGPTLLAEHLDRGHGVRLSAETVRRWMRDAELWERQRKRAKHRSRRPRRAAVGELCQWDSSVHPWLEERGADDLVLIAMHDDATNRLQTARFVERDNGAENRRAVIEYLRRHGRPLAFYADHAGHFGQWMTKQGRRTDTIISRGLDKLGVKMILAGSAQAKGRVERSFGTAQDRLVKEMRVGRIASLAEANRFLAECWVPFWNERFTVAPGDPCDAHRPLPEDVDLDALFAETHTRVVANDFTVRFRNRYWQLPEREAAGAGPGTKVVVERRLDGSIRFRVGERYLAVEPLGRERPRAQDAKPVRRPRSKSAASKSRSAPPKPGSDHPWRKRFHAEAQAAIARRERLAREAARTDGEGVAPCGPGPAEERR